MGLSTDTDTDTDMNVDGLALAYENIGNNSFDMVRWIWFTQWSKQVKTTLLLMETYTTKLDST